METLKIKKEQLDIAKEWIQTGEVSIYRETITEEQNFSIPIKREELVIKKKCISPIDPEHKDEPTEIIRILLNEEHVEFNKHKVDIEDVAIYKQQIEDIKHIQETLKSENPIVEISESRVNY